MEKNNLESMMLEKEVAAISTTRYVMDLKRSLNRLEAKKCLLIKSSKEKISCLLQTNTSGGISTKTLLNHIAFVYLAFAFSSEKSFLRYCRREVSEIIPSTLELRKDWKRSSESVEKWKLAEKMG